MRPSLTLALALLFTCGSAQDDVTGEKVASVHVRGAGSTRVQRWSGSGGTFPKERPGGAIEPLTMRVITWEFGDGSLSRILPPRPWSPSDGMLERRTLSTPFRERLGGSPCVSGTRAWPMDEEVSGSRPQLVSEGGVPVLVTTGMCAQSIEVRMQDPVTGEGPSSDRIYTSGRWTLGDPGTFSAPTFIILQDLHTGERWRAGIAW